MMYKIIEIEMAKLAVNRASKKEIEDIECTIKKMEEDIKEKGNTIEDSANMFHYKIFKASKNRIFYRIGILLNELNHESRSTILNNMEAQIFSLKEHKEIFSALKSRDEVKIENFMKKHLNRVEKTYKFIERNKKRIFPDRF